MWGRSDNDLKQYRDGYPNQKDDPEANDNLDFYQGRISSQPHGDFIDQIHETWFGDYNLLEVHHGYIQWLFPIREHGMNSESQRLHKHELDAMAADPECMKRLIKSYRLMLDFYGLKLESEETGAVAKSDNWKHRFSHLNSSFHNYLRITRILKCLGEFGFESWKKHLLDLFIYEAFKANTLKNIRRSLEGYWVGTLRDDKEREKRERRVTAYLRNDFTNSEDASLEDSEESEDKKALDEAEDTAEKPVETTEVAEKEVVKKVAELKKSAEKDMAKSEDDEDYETAVDRYAKYAEDSSDSENELPDSALEEAEDCTQ